MTVRNAPFQRLNIGEDVAGATFMAAGSSAPELFTSIIGVFIAKGDVGVGTIVGSAVFNILAIIGLCGIAAGMVVELTWWPLFRDTSYYSLAIVILIVVIFNGEVTWYESVIMLVMYAIYIVIMKFNSKIVWKMAQRKVEKEHEEHGDHVDTHSIGLPEHVRTIYEEENGERNSIEISVPMVQMDKVVRRKSGTEREEAIQRYLNQRRSSATSLEYQRQHRLEYPEAVTKLMLGKQFSAKTRLQMATRVIIQEQQKKRDDNLNKQRSSTINQSQMSMNSSIGAIMKSNRALKHEITKSYLSLSGAFSPSYINIAHGAPETEEDEQEEFDDWKKGPPTADGCVAVLKWVLFLPLQCLFYVSVPDCRKQRWERWFFVTFTMSIVWIAVFSYVMVWMVAIIGYTIHIPDSIMGITFLAAGTSIPDGMASLIVAKQGLGDMAVSNSIGSNVFDILLGLALPWFVKTAIVSSGETVHINSNGLVYSVILLFGTVVVTIGSIHFNKWKLDRKLGFGLLVVYVVFLVFSCLIEFNVFGYVNAPPCARTGY
ncbi:PREDICTED: sodium/potassium/calcium exchanger 3-like isoform X2 [Priapulus caudatus]|uniref:Sodium/potassium/calcium exchanger 3-like isoform X2 n=1 Tax=Priapulus caudatus TaxID=37621 RepID=A0ABM1EQZ4_PRICU|nr:PREDICTED: sodium/potassium/calcium exchanger 3-like isoform X2 [Priapulus caudatus]